MTREEKIEAIENVIVNYLTDDKVLEIYNDALSFCEDEIMIMDDDLDKFFEGYTASEIIDRLDSDFCLTDTFFRKNSLYDTVESTCDIWDFISNTRDIAEYVLDSEDAYFCPKLEELFEKWEATEEFESILDRLQDIEIDKFNAYVESLDDDGRIMFRIEEIIER